MAKTIVGLYDDFSHAEMAVKDLVNAGFSRNDISLIANNSEGKYSTESTHESHGTGAAVAGGAGIGAGIGGLTGLLVGLGALAIPGIGPIIAAGPIATTLAGAGIGAAAGGLVGALTKLGVPEEEAHIYSEGVRRGGTLVTCKCSDEMADQAASIMSRHHPVDIDRRSESWRKENWQRFDETREPMTTSHLTQERDRRREEERIPIVEEKLNVGKREVQKGGVRVHSWVEEVPVQSKVDLREEEIHVTRRPVEQPVGAAADAFRDKTIEMRETREEPVVGKQAHVKEEVVVSKDVTHRTEEVGDTVRRTQVDVDRGGTGTPTGTGHVSGTGIGSTTGIGTGGGIGMAGTGSGMGADTGMVTDYRAFDPMNTGYRSHFDKTYASRGMTYDTYTPAYRYGYELNNDNRYQGRDWTSMENDVRRDWESRHSGHGRWEDVKDAVRHAWELGRR